MTGNLGWEKAVLGTALHEPTSMEEAEDLLPSDFTDSHQVLWGEMLALYRRDALDLRALVEVLRSNNQLNEIVSLDTESSGEEYLVELLSYRGTAMREYADNVLDISGKRQLRMVSAMIRADAEDEQVTFQEAADEAERRLINLRRTRSVEMGHSLGDIMAVFNTRLTGFIEGTLEPAWTPRIHAIRDIVSFVDQDDFVIIAARPGEGKSSIMRYEFIQEAEHGRPVLLFNLENGELEYAKFALSLMTGIDSDRLKDPRGLSEEEVALVREKAEYLSRLPFYVKTMGAPSVYEIDRVTRQHIVRHGVELIGVDYIQLIANGQQRKIDDVTTSSSHLRGMALRYGVPHIAASQMSRQIEQRGVDAEPKLSDLRESGSLEQDATMVWFPRALWPEPTEGQLRLFVQNIDPETNILYRTIKAMPIKVHVAKNRNGGTGTTRPFLWWRSTNNFLPLRDINEARRENI